MSIDIAEFRRQEAELLESIPEEFRGFVSKRAWDDGHAYGYQEVLNHIVDLIDELDKPIADYTARLRYKMKE